MASIMRVVDSVDQVPSESEWCINRSKKKERMFGQREEMGADQIYQAKVKFNLIIWHSYFAQA